MIDQTNAPQIRAKFVVSGGNNTLTENCLDVLQHRGICVVPDFVASAGGIIGSQVDFLAGSVEQAFAAMDRLISAAAGRIVRESLASGVDPTRLGRRWVAERIARSRDQARKPFAQAMAETRDLLGVF